MFNGNALSLQPLADGLWELVLDLQGSSVNKFDALTLGELQEVLAVIEREQADIRGLLVRSAKPAFVVGADINAFAELFARPSAEVLDWVADCHQIFSALESLPMPTVSAINGLALGGGFELALATDYRIMAADARVGLPEVTLGLCPGWGGTVRLSRLLGAEAALGWMLEGKPRRAEQALADGAVDQVVPADELQGAALACLRHAVAEGDAYLQKRQSKQQIRSVNEATLEERFGRMRDTRYPAPGAMLEAVALHLELPLAEALRVETQTFVALGQSDTARALLGLFVNEQLVKRKAKAWGRKSEQPVAGLAVLGAGIMGGGIAYQAAISGLDVVMKDIRDEALTLGMDTATRLLERQMEKGRLDAAGKDRVLAHIRPTLDDGDLGGVELVVEAVVENPEIKAAVLAEVERQVEAGTVLTSNTSTISIDRLADSLQRPERFCGMHFFNPVHQMPLVEVIRGRCTSEAALGTTMALATTMGKTPIMVNDCPGFLVNRVLFPYFNGFNRLLRDGVDFQRIDRVMEDFGWPMGPAYLADVIGIDTMVHADQVLQAGFPQRMGHEGTPVMEELLARGDLGQKNGRGFYVYGKDAQGRRSREPREEIRALIAAGAGACPEVSDAEIIERLMLPMCFESVRCLEEGIVETPAEVDMGLILGLGFPRFRGGPLRHLDTLGLARVAEQARRHADQGPLYAIPDDLQQRLASQGCYFPVSGH